MSRNLKTCYLNNITKRRLGALFFGCSVIVIAILCSLQSVAQNGRREIDSLQSKIQDSKSDSGRVNLLCELGKRYLAVNSDSALYFGQEGLKLSTQLNWEKGKGVSYNLIGQSMKYKFNYKEALVYYAKAVEVFKNQPELKKELAKSYDNMGVIYHNVNGDYDSAMLLHKKALDLYSEATVNDSAKIAEECSELGNVCSDRGEYNKSIEFHYKALKIHQQRKNDTIGIAKSSNDIGNVCYLQGSYEKAQMYFSQALTIYKSLSQRDTTREIRYAYADCLNNLSNLYLAEKKYDSASENFEKALTIYEKIKANDGIIANLNNVAQCYLFQRNYQKALESYFKGLKLAESYNIKDKISIYLGSIGEAYLAIYKDTGKVVAGNNIMGSKGENLKKAIEYLNQALIANKEVQDQENIKEFSQYLSEAYKISGNYKSAYDLYVQYTNAKDTLDAQDSRKMLLKQETEAHKEILDKQTKLDELQVLKNRNETIFLYIGMVVMLFIIGLVVRSNMRQNKSNKIITREKKRSDELLLNILPAEVAEELKGSAEAKYFQEVTVFFSDFVGFTKVSERMSPQQLVNELDACFKGFDHIMTKYNIEKIKTVGDAYLAVSGLPLNDPNHAEKIIRAAIEIRDFQLERKRLMGDMTFEVRIGAHSGSVVAGIVGVKKFAYDIWGDTVNTAARMEQNSAPGRINISEATYERVKDKFACEFRGKIQAKNKGELSMYFVNESLTDEGM